MPHLITNQAAEPGAADWRLQTAPADSAWPGSTEWQPGQPLLLQGDEEPQQAFTEASSIAIHFAAFNDGRGLSLAVLLRERFNYEGEIRAVGEVHEDILHYMIRCGFSSFELPDERDPQVALASLQPYSDHYQASVTQRQPAFRRRSRG